MISEISLHRVHLHLPRYAPWWNIRARVLPGRGRTPQPPIFSSFSSCAARKLRSGPPRQSSIAVR